MAEVPASREAIRGLIGQLASPRFEERDAAARKLSGMDEAAPALRGALASPDAEVRRRAGLILAEHRKRQDARALPRMRAIARAGEADRLVDALTGLSPSSEDRAGWDAALDLAVAIGGDRVMQLNKPLHDFFLKDFGTPDLPCVRTDGTYTPLKAPAQKGPTRTSVLIRAGSVTRLPPGSRCVVASRGEVAAESGGLKVVLANGAGRFQGTFVDMSVVVCDGDFAAGGLCNCLVIASGNVTVGPRLVADSFIRAGGRSSSPRTSEASPGSWSRATASTRGGRSPSPPTRGSPRLR